jgi:type II secretory pathway pseudopilin PulG
VTALPFPICDAVSAPMRQRGFSYLLLLFAVAALGIASAGSALLWSTLAQTERERELLFIGGEFSRALQRYFDASPAEPKRYPATLQELIEDKRQPTPLRHLRKIYFDPMTRSQDWGLVIGGGQIRAVYSKSEQPARITVLPAWVDATGDKLASSLKNAAPAPGVAAPPTALNATPVVRGKPGERRHADWLFVPMPTGGTAASAADGGTGAGGSGAGGPEGGSSDAGSPTDPGSPSSTPGRSLQEIYTGGRDTPAGAGPQ